MRFEKPNQLIFIVTIIVAGALCSDMARADANPTSARPWPANSAFSTAEARPSATQDLFVEGTTLQETYSTSPVPILGMSLTIPAAGPSKKFALVTFNAPYEDTECGDYEIMVGSMNFGTSQICSNTSIQFVPATIVTKIPLGSSAQTVQAEFNGVGGDPIAIEVFYTLSAILTQN